MSGKISAVITPKPCDVNKKKTKESLGVQVDNPHVLMAAQTNGLSERGHRQEPPATRGFVRRPRLHGHPVVM